MSDEAARERIARDFASNLVVEASAGSGKTHCLVTRVVQGIARGAYAPEHIGAITFTRKAAAELSLRLRRGLEQAGLPGRLREQVWVGTIHSFCGNLLRQFPVESGLSPTFRELDESQDLSLQSRVLRMALDLEWGQQMLACLTPWGAGVEDLRQALASVCDRGELDFCIPSPVDPPDWTLLRAEFASFSTQLQSWLPPGADAAATCRIIQAARTLAERLSGHERLDGAEGIRWLLAWENAPDPVLRYWGQSRAQQQQILAPVQKRMDQFCHNTVGPALRQCRERLYGQLMPFLLQLRQLCLQRRRSQGLVNYNDLLCAARNLLRGHPSVRGRLQERYRHLLVDEFQDTDPLQAEIFLLLAENEQGIRPGSLFLVGDPKQSIYRFRHADISVYQSVAHRVVQAGGALLTLSRSFRCSQPLCDWINGAFSALFPPLANPVQAAYGPLQSARLKAPENAPVSTLTQAERRMRESVTSEAEFIADAIASSGRPPGDFLILTCRRAETRKYYLALKRRGIPCSWSVESSEAGAWTAEMLDLLWVLAQPADRVALVGLLRGPWMGHSDQDIYCHHQEAGPITLMGEVAGTGPVSDSLRELQGWRELARSRPAASLVLYLGRQLGLDQGAEEGELEALAEAVSLRQQAGLTLLQCVQELREGGPLAPPPEPVGPQGRVRVLNLHKAKGLEAPVVFLAAPAYGLPCQVDWVRDCHLEPGSGALMTFRSARSRRLLAQPPGWQERSQPEKAFLEAEWIRLLYVAATRARDQLIVCRWSGKGGAWSLLEPFLQTVPELLAQSAAGTAALDVESSEGDDFWHGEACLKPGWQRQTVSAANHADWPLVVQAADDDEPGGREWGSLIHRLLEELVRSPQLSSARLEVLARWHCLEFPHLLPFIDKALETVERVKQTPLWALVLQSSQRLVEVPFGHREGDRLIFGVIDLLLEQVDGWDLVDHKTDRSPLEALIARYAAQIEQYARSWTDITGETVRSRQIFGVRQGELIEDRSSSDCGGRKP